MDVGVRSFLARVLIILALLAPGIGFSQVQLGNDATPGTLSNKVITSPTNSFSNMSLVNNQIYAGVSSAANSWMFLSGATLSGVASQGNGGFISPFTFYIGNDTTDTTTSGNGYLIGMDIEEVAGTGHTGGRTAHQDYLVVNGAPTSIPTIGYTATTSLVRGNANIGGTSTVFVNTAGGIFGGNDNVYNTSLGTFYRAIVGREIDVSAVEAPALKSGLSVVQGSGDAANGTYDDSAIQIASQDGPTVGWAHGIAFGAYSSKWPFTATSTLIEAEQRQSGPTSNSIALYGVDFRNVTFQSGGAAFISTGYSVDPSGNLIANNFPGNVGASVTNIAVGVSALNSATVTGTSDTAVGNSSLAAATGTLRSTAIGALAAAGVTSGSDITAVGDLAGATISTSAGLTAVGSGAAQHATNTGITAVGLDSQEFTSSGAANTSIGSFSLQGITGTPLTGANNTAVGYAALATCQGSCANNVIIGYEAGFASNAITTGSSNVLIGASANTVSATTNSEINIGGAVFGYAIAPTLTSGWGTSPVAPAQTSTFSFSFTVSATGSPATTGVIGLPTSPLTGWNCSLNDQTTALTARQSANSATSATFAWSSLVGVSTAPSTNDLILGRCAPY